MAAVYAENTKVPATQSRAEIERDLKRFKADAFVYGEEGLRRIVQFRIGKVVVRLELVVPADERAERVKWRSLVLYVKARLAAVQAGITTLEDAFMADVLLPDGQRAGAWLRPQLEIAYANGAQPKMLPAPDLDRRVE